VKHNYIFISIICFILGIITAIGVLYSIQTQTVRFDNPIMQTLHVHKPEIVGFLPYWLLTKADKNYAYSITTLTYFGLTINADGTVKKLTNPQEEEPGWTTLKGDVYAKRQNESSKTNIKQSLLVISGDDDVISTLIENPITSATNLVNDVAPIMKDKKFTDLNLDIESFMEASESAQANFTAFVIAVKKLVTEQKLGTVSLDLIPISLVKQKLYNPKALGAIVDRIILMTYDYHYSGSFTAGANAPLGGAGQSLEFDVETAVKEALKVIPANKILLGIPLYGYQWETIDEASGSATIPGGASTASVRRVTEMITSCATCSAQFDPVAREPYLIIPEENFYNQIYFENERSMQEKVDLAKKYSLGGVALWALGYEDDKLLGPLTKYKKNIEIY
jgi:spore germination protein YaaH